MLLLRDFAISPAEACKEVESSPRWRLALAAALLITVASSICVSPFAIRVFESSWPETVAQSAKLNALSPDDLVKIREISIAALRFGWLRSLVAVPLCMGMQLTALTFLTMVSRRTVNLIAYWSLVSNVACLGSFAAVVRLVAITTNPEAFHHLPDFCNSLPSLALLAPSSMPAARGAFLYIDPFSV